MYFHLRGMDRTAQNPKLSVELLHVQQFTFRSMSIQQDRNKYLKTGPEGSTNQASPSGLYFKIS